MKEFVVFWSIQNEITDPFELRIEIYSVPHRCIHQFRGSFRGFFLQVLSCIQEYTHIQ